MTSQPNDQNRDSVLSARASPAARRVSSSSPLMLIAYPHISWLPRHRTLYVEAFHEGVRLTATDRFVIASSYVSCGGVNSEHEEPLESEPLHVAIVQDIDQRGKALLAYARRLAQRCANEDPPLPAPKITIRWGVPAPAGTDEPLPGMTVEHFAIELADDELVVLPTIEGAYPKYRTLIERKTRKQGIVGVIVNPDLVARVAQMGKLIGGSITMKFRAPDKLIDLAIVNDGVWLTGGLMPLAGKTNPEPPPPPEPEVGETIPLPATPGSNELDLPGGNVTFLAPRRSPDSDGKTGDDDS